MIATGVQPQRIHPRASYRQPSCRCYTRVSGRSERGNSSCEEGIDHRDRRQDGSYLSSIARTNRAGRPPLSDCSGMSAPAFALVSTNSAPSTARSGQVGALENRARGTRHRVHPDDATGFLPTVRTVRHIKIRTAVTISAIALGSRSVRWWREWPKPTRCLPLARPGAEPALPDPVMGHRGRPTEVGRRHHADRTRGCRDPEHAEEIAQQILGPYMP
jgi:hypothetical protein